MYCEKCKSQVEDISGKCPQCGHTLINEPQSAIEEFETLNQQATEAESVHEKYDNIMMIAGYISPLLLLIPFLLGRYKKSAYVHFHTWQIIRLTIVSVAGSLILQLVTAVIPVMVVAVVCGLASVLLSLFCLVLYIIGIIRAWRYETTPLPIVGTIFDQIGA